MIKEENFSKFMDIINDIIKSLGIDYTPNFMDILSLRAGFREKYVLDNVENNWTVGMGLEYKNIRFSYAYEKSDHIEYEHKHYYSMSYTL